MWKTVLFDLDGTLTDSAEGITKCVQYALSELGYEVSELSELNCFVGPPLHDMFMSYTGMDSDMADKAVALYRERYVPTGMFENKLYPSVIELLNLLKKNGVIMGVASSKPEIYVKQILEHFGISDYFKVVVGSELDGRRVAKKEVLEEAIHRLHMEKKRDQIVLVGDTAYDVLGANEADIDCIAVTYGYGDRAEMERVKPVYIAQSVSDVIDCVLSCDKKPHRESSFYQVWRIIYPILIHYSLFALASSALGLTYIFYKLGTQGMFNAERIPVKLMEYNNYITLGVSILSIIVFGWFYHRDENKRIATGIRNRLMHKEPFGILHMVFVAVFFVTSGLFLNQMITWSEISKLFDGYEAVAETLMNKEEMLVSFACVGIFAPIAEELLFRGLVYRRIRDYIDVKWGIIISALLFGMVHGNMIQFIYATLLGVLLALAYERYKNLLAPIIAHMAANIFTCILEFKGISNVPDSMKKFALLLAVEIVIISVLGTVVLRKWVPKSKEQNQDDADQEDTASLTEEDVKIDTYEGDSEPLEVQAPKKEKLSYRSVLDDYDDEELDRIIAAYEAKKAERAAKEAEQAAKETEQAPKEAVDESDKVEEAKEEPIEEEAMEISDFSNDAVMMEQFAEALESEASNKENLELEN